MCLVHKYSYIDVRSDSTPSLFKILISRREGNHRCTYAPKRWILHP